MVDFVHDAPAKRYSYMNLKLLGGHLQYADAHGKRQSNLTQLCQDVI